MMRISHRFVNWIRLTFGIVLIVSSVLKAVGIKIFAHEAGKYIDLYMPQWLHGWNMLCAIGVCVLELAMGLLLVLRKHLVWTSALSLLLLTFFVWLTGTNLFFPTIFGTIESCGCFGELIHFTPVGSFVKSVVLWVLSLVLFVKVILDWKND